MQPAAHRRARDAHHPPTGEVGVAAVARIAVEALHRVVEDQVEALAVLAGLKLVEQCGADLKRELGERGVVAAAGQIVERSQRDGVIRAIALVPAGELGVDIADDAAAL